MGKKKKKGLPLKIKSISQTDLIPLILVVAVVPLIVRLTVIPVDGIAMDYWTGTNSIDFFSYNKSIFLLFATVTATILFLLRYFEGKIKIKPLIIYYPLGIYALLIFLSTVFAEHTTIAFIGFPERYEGGLILLAYLLVAFLTANFIQTHQHVNIILVALFISASLAGVLGIFQYIGLDFFQTSLGRSLILPAEFKPFADELTFHFGKHTIYGTFYNTNYVGSYTAMLLPLSIVLLYFFKERPYLYGTFAFSCLMFAMLIGSNSRAGLVGTFVALLIIIAFLFRSIHTRWRLSLGLAVSFFTIFIMLNTLSDGKPLRQINSLLPLFLASASATSPATNEFMNINLEIKDIQLGENTVIFIFNGGRKLLFINENQVVTVQDETGGKLDYTYDDTKRLYYLQEYPFNQYGFAMEDNILFLNTGRLYLSFKLIDDQFYFINGKGEAVLFEPAESLGFRGREKMGNSRGYIWSRSLPMVKDTFFLGYGPDTYPIYFPQDEFLAKILYLQGPFKLVDKPHNMYLQTAINTGLLSLLSMLTMFGIYMAWSFRLYFRNVFSSYFTAVGTGCFIAICGYLVAGAFNDSLVSVAPVFWILFGMGLACNYLSGKGDFQSSLTRQ